jgi:hypothetical protein
MGGCRNAVLGTKVHFGDENCLTQMENKTRSISENDRNQTEVGKYV